ncbi:hypothetical protein [Gilliamella apicola]|uniref:Uncharacterized protein n=2 Tax=Gilliamella apicola TaxID=1196095 RepID=A0A2C9XXZ5_9GAMM|nr:hypothetical protein [Gilliamella apicola]OCG10553.1 hypothetical protein A9G14_10025 [Gilliamella apicola]ORF43642.1 hypothetical protein B5800_13565 [Gilliamella apicola]ORF47141.1 hypothetical protein B5799_13585 [Gilliamella apicola]ORF49702.1 hypothetical protein B5803_10175 [Gilliamella apicola]ORF50712.1 hypothetical protein B5802_12495 [Gilliamella apicola]
MKLDEINRIIIENNVLNTMHMDIEPISFKYNLLLSLSDDENSRDKVSFYFYDVSSVKMKDIGGGLTQFMHLKISIIDIFNDRNKYIIEDIEDEKLSFEFNAVDFLG